MRHAIARMAGMLCLSRCVRDPTSLPYPKMPSNRGHAHLGHDAEVPMTVRFRDSWMIRIGVALLVLGTGPLLAIMFAASFGWTDDPNPNPIGPGLLCMFTFWPSIILIIIGVVTVRGARTAAQHGPKRR
jgi:hypothetical protein